jgi:hypothetical protein
MPRTGAVCSRHETHTPQLVCTRYTRSGRLRRGSPDHQRLVNNTNVGYGYRRSCDADLSSGGVYELSLDTVHVRRTCDSYGKCVTRHKYER